MNNNDGFDWLDEVQRRRIEPENRPRTLLIEGVLYLGAMALVGYALGNIA